MDRLLSCVILNEVNAANRVLEEAGVSLEHLNKALEGRCFFRDETREVYADIVHDLVPASWDTATKRRKKSLRKWLQDLREHIIYLMSRLGDEKVKHAAGTIVCARACLRVSFLGVGVEEAYV